MLSDEWQIWSGADIEHIAHYKNTLVSNEIRNNGKSIWVSYYNYLYTCNAAIEGIKNNKKLSPNVVSQLLGEAYFLRGWLIFNLFNLYGEVPLPVSADPQINRLLPRSSVSDVIQYVVQNLKDAHQLLSEDFLDVELASQTSHRLRPTKWAATALLSRVYLYAEQWSNAEAEASKVIENNTLFSIRGLDEVFQKNNQESIWQLQPVSTGYNTLEGRRFNLSASPAGLGRNKQVAVSKFVLADFESGDQRFIEWLDSLKIGSNVYYFPFKYKKGQFEPTVTSTGSLTEYSVVLRLSELYLIRAEARAKQNKLSDAISDLDVIRGRAMLPLIADVEPGISQLALLEKILHERRVEFFSEWGHRWFDLKRTGKLDEVMSVITPQKGGDWSHDDRLLPIPYNDLLTNPKLVQNAGY